MLWTKKTKACEYDWQLKHWLKKKTTFSSSFVDQHVDVMVLVNQFQVKSLYVQRKDGGFFVVLVVSQILLWGKKKTEDLKYKWFQLYAVPKLLFMTKSVRLKLKFVPSLISFGNRISTGFPAKFAIQHLVSFLIRKSWVSCKKMRSSVMT